MHVSNEYDGPPVTTHILGILRYTKSAWYLWLLLVCGKNSMFSSLTDLWRDHHVTLLPWASGRPVAIQCSCNLDPSVHWNATGEMPVCFQWSPSGLPVAFQWSFSVFQLCKLTLDRHWNTTGCWHQSVWFQWHPSVLVAPVVFQCGLSSGIPVHWQNLVWR